METGKQIAERVNKAVAQPSSVQERTLMPLDSKILDLWDLMLGMYGNQWTNKYGEIPDPHRVWTAALKEKSSADIKRGLNALAGSGKPWPPSVPEFVAMCRAESQPACHRPWRPDRALERHTKQERREMADQWLPKIRKKLEGENHD